MKHSGFWKSADDQLEQNNGHRSMSSPYSNVGVKGSSRLAKAPISKSVSGLSACILFAVDPLAEVNHPALPRASAEMNYSKTINNLWLC